ncbi:hypothetical protein ACHQM5_018124 [Ranunculus cassubicifolius]
MARFLDDIGFKNAPGSSLYIPGGLLLLCMIITALSIISLILFACGDQPKKSGRSHCSVDAAAACGGVCGGDCGGG